jgi:hypothetical protein
LCPKRESKEIIVKKEGGIKMETKDMARKGLYVGTGVGLILFALVGFFMGSFLGGVIGLKISGAIMGSPVQASLLPRIMVAAGMIVGILVSGLICVVGVSLAGWVTGTVVDAVKSPAYGDAHSVAQGK